MSHTTLCLKRIGEKNELNEPGKAGITKADLLTAGEAYTAIYFGLPASGLAERIFESPGLSA